MIRDIGMLAALAATPLASAPQAAPFDWMVGTWCIEPRRSMPETSCEEWRIGPDGGMRGTSLEYQERITTVEERMEIRRDGDDWVFHAEPKGQAPADFRAGADDLAALAVTFENPSHDYPQRIRYWREGDRLTAEIAMLDGSRAVRWEYTRVGE